LRRLVDGYAHTPMLVGEVFLVAPHEMSDYSGPGAFHCAVNLASAPRTIALVGDWRVEAGTHRTQAGTAFDGSLAADEAVVLGPD
jgi:hypothetical protein